jgi:hypothetical protein
MDEAVYAGGVEWIAAYKQGLNRESSSEVIVSNMSGNQLPDRSIPSQSHQLWKLPDHRSELMKRFVSQLGKANIEDVLRFAQQFKVAINITRIKLSYLGKGFLDGSTVIKN